MASETPDYTEKVRKYCEEHQFDYQELARMVGVPLHEIQDLIIFGHEDEIYIGVDIDMLFKVLTSMDYSIYELFEEKDEMLDYRDDFLARILIHLKENNLLVSEFESIAGWVIIDLYMRDVKKRIDLQMIVDVCGALKLNWIQILYALYRLERI